MADLGLIPIVENQMDKKMEIEKDTGVIYGFAGAIAYSNFPV